MVTRRMHTFAGLIGVAASAPLWCAASPAAEPAAAQHMPSTPHASPGIPHAGPGAPRPDAAAPRPAPLWGFVGHLMAARAAVSVLPDDMPDFFLQAGEQLVYLNPEPDRWRVREQEEMDQGFAYDHYIDLENVPQGGLDASDRFDFLRILYAAGIARPERDVGFLPFRILELYQRLVTEWRLWRAEEDPVRRGWIAERIVNDAGILGHYVTDASQPHHTTIHFNGWVRGAPNPERFTRDPRFHARFERFFVEAHVTGADVARHMSTQPPPPPSGWVREAVMAHILAAHEQVEMLYRLDLEIGFDPDAPAHEATVEFAAARIAAGAQMLAALWVSAWNESAAETPGPARPDA